MLENIKANGRRIVVVEDKKIEEKNEDGLYLPETQNKNIMSGIVVKAGDGRYENGVFVKNEIKEGYRVYYQNFNPTYVSVDSQILAVLDSFEVLIYEVN